jgi:hypothetical protein
VTRRRLLRPAVLIPAFIVLSLAAGIGYAAYERVDTSAVEANAHLIESLPDYPGAREAARRAQAYAGEGGLPAPEGIVTTVVYEPPADATQEDVLSFYLSRLHRRAWRSETTTLPVEEAAGENVYRVSFERGEECVTLMTYGMAPAQDPDTRSFGLAASTEEGGCG